MSPQGEQAMLSCWDRGPNPEAGNSITFHAMGQVHDAQQAAKNSNSPLRRCSCPVAESVLSV